jgi:hypothetical protein
LLLGKSRRLEFPAAEHGTDQEIPAAQTGRSYQRRQTNDEKRNQIPPLQLNLRVGKNSHEQNAPAAGGERNRVGKTRRRKKNSKQERSGTNPHSAAPKSEKNKNRPARTYRENEDMEWEPNHATWQRQLKSEETESGQTGDGGGN